MPCFICNKSFNLGPGTTKYMKPSQLTCKLQDRKWEPGAFKPDVKILEALEDISDGDVSLDVLKRHAPQYVCHECQVNLRQAVNKKAELEHHILKLNEKFCVVSNTERRSYYREKYGKDKCGRCWACMYQFVPKDYQKFRSDRFHLASKLVQGMSVSEAIRTLLEKEAEALDGLYEKRTYICKRCVQLLRNVVRAQCVFDSLQTGFKSITDEDSTFARLLMGEKVPFVVDSDKEEEVTQSGPLKSQNSSPEKSLSNLHRSKKRSLHKNQTDLPVAQTASPKKRKLSATVDTVVEDEDIGLGANEELESDDLEDLGMVSESDNESSTVVNTDSRNVVNTNPVNKLVSTLEDNGKSQSGLGDSCKEALAKTSDTCSKDDGKVTKHRYVSVKLNLQSDEVKVMTIVEGKKGQDIKDRTKIANSAATGNAFREKTVMSDDWVLYYYPNFSGRAEFIRLVFEEAGIPYRECEESFADIRRLINEGEMEGYPHFAPPVVKKGSLQLSQTPVICRYLGEEFGLYPESLEDKLHAEQISQCCHDFIAEGRLSFHGKNPVGPYLSQKEETQPYIDRFVSERLPRWLKFFERALIANNGGKGFLFGEKICYCDLSLFHILHATESQFPEAYKSADYIPMLKDFKERIASRTRIAAYLRSDRWKGFSGDSMM